MAAATMVDEAVLGPLWPAVAASIALHAAVLAGLPDFWTPPEPQVAVPLNARLEPGPQVAAPTAAAAPVAPASATHDVVPPRRRSTAPKATFVPREVPVALPDRSAWSEPARATEPPAEAPVNSAAASDSPTAAPQIADPAPAAPIAALAPQRGDGADEPGSLAQYRLALIGTAKRHKLYPSQAIARGWQGRVEVRLVIGADGVLSAASIKRSSGYDMLDRQSLDMLRKAHALTPIPPALRGRDFAVEIPVVYELKSEG
ncbi:MAG TPA: TonB family protein [Burkholderiales bacterium]|nr:TonB family protein [Burkholderiales bacterium]